MSQAGKVLHLYVEVRSVPEDEGKLLRRGDDGNTDLMLQCPDVLSHSRRNSTRSSPNRSPDLSPLYHHRIEDRSHSLSPSKSSSRHSVSFQLQHPDATGSPTQVHQQDVLNDSFGQLLQVLAPEIVNSGQRGSQRHTHSPKIDSYQGSAPISPTSTSSSGLTVPSTPTSNCRSYRVPEECAEGKTSVVTFGYIEKANIQGMGTRRTSMCQSELDNPFNRMEGLEGQFSHIQKRLSDPVFYNGQTGQGNLYPGYLYPSQNKSPRGSPHLQRATLDAVARDSTTRALEEFGSPDLRRRFAGYRQENHSPTLPRHYQSPRCRSWAGSPVLSRSTLTLPSRVQYMELERGHNAVNGLPRSPASDQLCAHSGYSVQSASQTSNLHSCRQSQRPWLGDESPRVPSKFHPPLTAGTPTEIQYDVPLSTYPSRNHSRNGYQCSRSSSKASDVVSPTNGRRSFSPFSNTEVACKLALEASKLSTFAERRTPSPTPPQAESLRLQSPKIGRGEYANSHKQSSPESLQADKLNHRWKTDKEIPQTRPGSISPQLLSQKVTSSPVSPALPTRLHHAASSQSPILVPCRQLGSSPIKDLSSLHRYQPPQYTGHSKYHGTDLRKNDHLFDRVSPELSTRLLSNQNPEGLPVSWTSRYQEWRETAPIQHWDQSYRQPNYRVYTQSKEDHEWTVGRIKLSTQGYQTPLPREEVQNRSTATGTSSQSSSGVTGSIGDSFQLDRNYSLSPETSSQSSHDTSDTGSGMQVCWVGW